MARLNEPAVPMESIELLRKRFLRQNKEIIRANSDQAIRIRALEAETSRLLSENITLREENIRLNHELSNGRHALALENVGHVKDKLQAFAAGLSGLVAELAEAQCKLPDPVPYHETAKRRSPKALLGQRSWKNGLNLAEIAEQEGRLPAILEDKYYPRRTLDLADIGMVLEHRQTVSDSPELGPPPVAHFDIEDPTQHHQGQNSPSPSKVQHIKQEEDQEAQKEPWELSANLETRKKRRASAFAKEPESGREELEEQKGERTKREETKTAPVRTVKIGGKRKLSMREDEAVLPAEDFLYPRRPGNENKQPAELPVREGKSARPKDNRATVNINGAPNRSEANAPAPTPTRRALGEKPVNTDPVVSPLKVRSRLIKDLKEDPFKAIDNKSAPASRSRPAATKRTTANPDNPKPAQKEVDIHQLPATSIPAPVGPATPAPPIGILSPATSSASRESNTRDTPPPADIGGRPSRRSRPAVSYAEPNLRDKMRRPTKELVPAVAADDKLKCSASLSASEGVKTDGTVATKEEMLPNWGGVDQELASPSAPKQNGLHVQAASLPENIIMERTIQEDSAVSPASDEQTNTTPLAAPFTESKRAATAGSSNQRLSKARGAGELRAHATAARAADGTLGGVDEHVFDFIDSSSPEASSASKSLPLRTGRRSSTVPQKLDQIGDEDVRRLAKGNGGHRRETMASNARLRGSENGVSSEHYQAEVDISSRTGRVATRRRSMML